MPLNVPASLAEPLIVLVREAPELTQPGLLGWPPGDPIDEAPQYKNVAVHQ